MDNECQKHMILPLLKKGRSITTKINFNANEYIDVQQVVNKSKQCYSFIVYTYFWNIQKLINVLWTYIILYITYNNKSGSNKTA